MTEDAAFQDLPLELDLDFSGAARNKNAAYTGLQIVAMFLSILYFATKNNVFPPQKNAA